MHDTNKKQFMEGHDRNVKKKLSFDTMAFDTLILLVSAVCPDVSSSYFYD